MLDKTKLDLKHQILLDAADRIEKYGWIQGHGGYGVHGEVCTVAAIWDICSQFYRTDDELKVQRLYNEITQIVANKLGVPDKNGVIQWNDAEERTVGEVINLLREAAFAEV